MQARYLSTRKSNIERYRRRQSSVEKALIRNVLSGSIRPACRGYDGGPCEAAKVPPSIISELNKKAYVHIEEWQNRHLYVHVECRNRGGNFENVAILEATAVNGTDTVRF